MTVKKTIYIGLFMLLILTTALLTSSVLKMSKKNDLNNDTILQLSKNIDQLKKKIAFYETEKEKFNFYQFKENVFNLKHPNFSQVARTVFKKSRQYGFNPYLVMAIIQVESNFDQYAVSSAGAYGLMQVNYSVWKDVLKINYNKIFEKEYNIELGLKILKHYYKKSSGDIFMALFRYNNGYKYNNVGYNGKIVATKFYSHQKELSEEKNPEKELSI